jgi:hypothetical protein
MNEQLRHYFVFRWKLIRAELWYLPRTSLQFLEYQPSSDGDIMDDGTIHISTLDLSELGTTRVGAFNFRDGPLNYAGFKK